MIMNNPQLMLSVSLQPRLISHIDKLFSEYESIKTPQIDSYKDNDKMTSRSQSQVIITDFKILKVIDYY